MAAAGSSRGRAHSGGRSKTAPNPLYSTFEPVPGAPGGRRSRKSLTREVEGSGSQEDVRPHEEAEEKLKERLKDFPKDLHAHLRLADVYVSLKNVGKALDEYVFVADSHAEDGFFDKGIALLSKAAKLAPGDDMLPRRIEKYKRLKMLEKRRQFAVKGLMANKTTGASTAANSAIQVEILWNKIVKSHLVEQLQAQNLEKLFSVMEMRKTETGEVLADDGSPLQVMYLVVDGVVEAGAEVNGQRTNVRSFTSGDLIGDSALLEKKSWPAEYKVTEPGTVFRLDREGLAEVMAGNDDPVRFLSALRQQQNDRSVAAALLKLRAS